MKDGDDAIGIRFPSETLKLNARSFVKDLSKSVMVNTRAAERKNHDRDFFV